MEFNLDLGGGHALSHYERDGDKFGAIFRHPKPDGSGWCYCRLWFKDPGYVIQQVWTVQSWEPLTLDPSVQCHCGYHGHIRDGKWVSA